MYNKLTKFAARTTQRAKSDLMQINCRVELVKMPIFERWQRMLYTHGPIAAVQYAHS